MTLLILPLPLPHPLSLRYQWTIVYCKQCRDHKGWLFDAVRKNLKPKSFYGLRRPSLALFKTKKDSDISRFGIR